MGAMPVEYANDHDRQLAGRYESRESDWRNGAVVYQLIVDRFAPSARLAAKGSARAAAATGRLLAAGTDKSISAWQKRAAAINSMKALT